MATLTTAAKTTTTTSVTKTFKMFVTFIPSTPSQPEATLVVASETGNKTCRINMTRARRTILTEEQSALLRYLVNASKPNETVEVTMTLAQLQELANVRGRTSDTAGSATVEATNRIAAFGGAVKVPVEMPRTGADRVETEVNVQAARINHLAKMGEKAKEDFYVLTYDIQDRLNKVCPNPSWAVTINARTDDAWRFPGMWALGARFNLSCWFLTESALNHPAMQRMLSHWRHHGARPRVVRFHPDECAKIREYIAEELRLEIVEIHRQLVENIDAADRRLAEAQSELQAKAQAGEEVTEKEVDAIIRRRDNEVRFRLNNVREKLAIALEAAERYDINEDVVDLFQGLRAARSAALEAFNASAAARGHKTARA